MAKRKRKESPEVEEGTVRLHTTVDAIATLEEAKSIIIGMTAIFAVAMNPVDLLSILLAMKVQLQSARPQYQEGIVEASKIIDTVLLDGLPSEIKESMEEAISKEVSSLKKRKAHENN